MPFYIGGDSINAQEKEVAQYLLDNEKALLEMLEKQYKAALNDINKEIQVLLSNELTQSKIYQLEYQKALKAQIEAILEQLHGKEFESIQQYLQDCYTNAFVGAAYNLAGQGIPLIMPIDQAAIVKAIMTDSKLSEGLYDSLGVDINSLKKSIREEIARGISTGMGFKDIARNISNATGVPFNHARTIVNTEGHRIQQTSNFDAQKAAKAKGAQVVKQWDSTLDGKTRDTHRQIDGQIKDVDEPFEIAGKEAMFPGDFGDPAEDCNCRCVSLTRAKWALDEEELQRMQDRAEFFGLDKTDDFAEYRDKYLFASQGIDMQQSGGGAMPPKDYDGVFDDFAELNLTREEQKALEALWELSQKSGFEYGLVIENGIVSNSFTSNLPNGVKIPLDDFGSALTLLHSHTNATPPSATDFMFLLDGKIDKIGVIGYNGDAFLAYIGSGETPSLEDFRNIANNIAREVNIYMPDDPAFFDWTIEERNYMAIREQAYRIARHFGWTLEGGRIDV